MDKPILKESMRLFDQLGQIKSRSMFGGFGIFADDIMFALVVNDKLHIRADDKLANQFKTEGLTPYVYKKRGFPVVTKYFALTDNIATCEERALSLAYRSLEVAKKEKTTNVDGCGGSGWRMRRFRNTWMARRRRR